MSKTKCEDVITLQGEVYIRKGSIEEKKVADVKSVQKHPFLIGKQIFIQTVTLYYVGILKAITETDFILEDAAWVADTGRLNEFMKTGNPNELEPLNGPVIINRGGYIAASHSVPTVQLLVK